MKLPTPQRFFALYDWDITAFEQDSLLCQKQLEEFRKAFKKQGATDLEKFAFYLANDQINFSHREKLEERAILDAIEYARHQHWTDLVAELEFTLASHLHIDQQVIPAIETMIEKAAAAEKIGWSNPYSRQEAYRSIGRAFHHFADYEQAIPYLRKAAETPIPNSSAGADYGNYNMLGLCYEKLLRYDSAIYYFKQALDIVQLQNDDRWAAVIKGNIGNAYYQLGDYESALPFLEADYQQSIHFKIIGSAVNVSSILANVELQRGNLSQAKSYVEFARHNLDTSALGAVINYHENLYTYSKSQGDYYNAVRHADSLKIYTARQEKVVNKEMLDKVRMRMQAEHYARDVQLLQAARSRQVLVRNGLIIILVLTGLIALLLAKRMEYMQRTHREKLSKAEADLNWFTKSLLEKNELIQSIREQMDQASNAVTPPSYEQSLSISQLTHASILTDEDWKRFRILFDEVYPGFLIRLKEKFNDLTPAELRLLALTKLRIEPKDMAAMLGISPDSIKKTRYRLRKKINLPEEGTLDELVRLG